MRSNIGQITMYGDNYGALLQAFALQMKLAEKKAPTDIILYNREGANGIKNNHFLLALKKYKLSTVLKYIFRYAVIKTKKDACQEFRDLYLKFSELCYGAEHSLQELNNNYERFICGSDMIWSEEFYDDWEFYYLGFAHPQRSFAYAPSFGKNEIRKSYIDYCNKLLSGISRISCREKGGCQLIKNITGKEVPQVLDPTMLLTKEDWSALIANDDRIIKKTYVFSYVFGKHKNFSALTSKLDRIIGRVYRLPENSLEWLFSPLKKVGPIEYVHLFRDAEFILTDTFHGMMFALIFEKPFLVLEREDKSVWARHSDRLTSTLDMLGLDERYVKDGFMDIELVEKLDYSAIRSIIDKKREESLEFLEEICL